MDTILIYIYIKKRFSYNCICIKAVSLNRVTIQWCLIKLLYQSTRDGRSLKIRPQTFCTLYNMVFNNETVEIKSNHRHGTEVQI